ncbi:MAG: hypothetical protein IKS87_06110, partial [Lachnospiraceae bacterium]|nr:hypothetical protein [Lachnospiraceae bacterium]
DKLKFNVGLQMRKGQEEEYFALADAGENWYEAKKQFECILDEGSYVNFMITPLDGKEKQVLSVELIGLPTRPERATRLRVMMEMKSETNLKIRIQDLGFGELFPSSGKVWTKETEIG